MRAREAEEAQRKKHENQQRIQKEQERRRVQSAARARTPVQINVQEVRMLECRLWRLLESFLRRDRVVGMSLGSGESVGKFSENKGGEEFSQLPGVGH